MNIKFFKIINFLFFIVFFTLNINYYFSKKFISKIKIQRSNYKNFLNTYKYNLITIKPSTDIKIFVDNTEYIEKIKEQPEFWKLIK